jgi:hypothetical protein
MKKILAILTLVVSGTAFAAGSFTLESQNVNVINGADQKIYSLNVKQKFSSVFTGDATFSNTQTDGTNALGTRLEAGVTASVPVVGLVKGYVRGAYGQKYSNTTDTPYYSIEPGVSAPLGPFTAKVGFRWRSAVDTAKGDQTHTVRVGLAYALTKVDSVAVGFDRARGDNNQNVVKVSYTRSF